MFNAPGSLVSFHLRGLLSHAGQEWSNSHLPISSVSGASLCGRGQGKVLPRVLSASMTLSPHCNSRSLPISKYNSKSDPLRSRLEFNLADKVPINKLAQHPNVIVSIPVSIENS